MQAALEAAIAELVLGAPLDAKDARAVSGWLTRHGVSAEDADALRAGGLERLLVYRSLVQGTLESALEASIPRTLSRLGPLFQEFFQRFLVEQGPRSHYIRDTTTEFLDFCEPIWTADSRVPAYLVEYARYEALHIEVASTPPRPPRAQPMPLDLDAGLAFTETARLVVYQFAVHELPEDLEDQTEPERRDTRLFVYRSPEHFVRYLAVSPVAAAILARLMQGASLRESLAEAAAEHRAELDDALLSGAARLLSDLSDRQAVLGPCQPYPGRLEESCR